MATRNSTQPTGIDFYWPCGVQGHLNPATALEARELGHHFLKVVEAALAAQPGVETDGKTLWAVLGVGRELLLAADRAMVSVPGGEA